MKKLFSLLLLIVSINVWAEVPSFRAVQTGERTYSVYFSNYMAPSDYYMQLMMLMIENQPTDIHLYLSGNGGHIKAVQDILSIKERFKIKFHAHIYGSIYSAHALLALNSDTIEAYNDYLIIMVHSPAIGKKLPRESCNNYWFWETDRGQSKKEKCIQNVENEAKGFNNLVLYKVFAVLTKKEIEEYYEGKDIYILWKELKKRLK